LQKKAPNTKKLLDAELESPLRRSEGAFLPAQPDGVFALGLALEAPVVQIGPGRLAKDVPLANWVRSGRKQP
jgi:hypothetical protein